MSMTTADELGTSDVSVKLPVMLSPLQEETVRRGLVIKELERGPFGGFLSADRQAIDQFLPGCSNQTSTQIPRSGDTHRRALQTTWRRALERLWSAISCLLNLSILECRDRNLQQTATARAWPLQPLQTVAPLQPSKSNLDANPPPRGHSPTGPATYVAVCSGATRECHFLPA